MGTIKFMMKTIVSLLILLTGVKCELTELECPDECDCHYFRVNWVTDCSESNLTEIPTPDDGLSLNVYILNMNGNFLKSVNPFPHDIKLRSLDLADNQLTKITYQEFAGLGYLLDIDLSGNNITSVEPETFRDSPGLLTLEMQANQLEVVEGPFLISRSLKYLDLSDCRLNKLTPHFFQNITALNKLDLSGNPLGSLETRVLDPLIGLEYLKLNDCNLTHISETAFLQNERIKMIELSNNNLKGPISWALLLGGLSNLEYLDLRKAAISNLPEDVFANNTWLRTLILAENELTDLDVATTLGHNLRHLDSLDLSDCNLVGPLSDDAFGNATKLRTLILSDNRLSASDLSVALAPLTRLQKLSLRNCSLTRLPANMFHRFTNLQELDISKNPLNNAFTALLSPLESLEKLDMGYSSLAHISKTTFSKMSSLKTLILSGNKLSGLESGLFQNLTHLEILELNYCGLTELSATVFPENYTYPELEELHLAGNPLQVPAEGPLLPRQLRKLKTLDLSDCNLTFIAPDALTSFGSITKLQLQGNNLSTTQNSFDFLKNLPHLQVLDFSRNNFTTVSPNVFKDNPEIYALKLVENPWICGCHITDMWEWAIAVKADLGVLVGSTTAAEDLQNRARRKKKGLLCYFDSKIAPVHKDVQFKKQGKKDFVDNVDRTWARYVRESACNSSTRLRPARLLISRQARDLSGQTESMKLMSSNGYMSFNTIMSFMSLTTLVLFVSTFIICAAIYRGRMKNTENSYRVVSHVKDYEETDIGRNYITRGAEYNLRKVSK